MKRLLAFAGLVAIYPLRLWELFAHPRGMTESEVEAALYVTRPRR